MSHTSRVLVPFGRNAEGRMVDALAVPNGLACNCHCPQCNAPLVARQGAVNVAHFAHYSVSDCRGAAETALHQLAKQILCDSRTITLPPAFIRIGWDQPERIMWHSRWTYDRAEVEPAIGSIRPDVLLANDFRRIAAEIFVAHQVEPEKIGRFARLGLDAIEIDLSHCPRFIPEARVRDQVLAQAPRAWLFCGIAQRAHVERISR